MKLSMLKRQITRYKNDAARYKHKADMAWAKYKSSGDQEEYLRSQYYYEQQKKVEGYVETYEAMLRNGEYEE